MKLKTLYDKEAPTKNLYTTIGGLVALIISVLAAIGILTAEQATQATNYTNTLLALVPTAITAIAGLISMFKVTDANAAKLFKANNTLTLILLMSLFTISVNAQKVHPLRIYPFKHSEVNTDKALFKAPVTVDSTFFFGASVAYDVFLKEMKSGDYSIGTMPGFGYGIKWDPKKNPFHTSSVLSLDLFAETRLDKEILTDTETPTVAKYFNIRILPMLGILDWIHVGYGPLFKIGVNGNKGYTDWVFSISISKTL
jgi:hypothetical protein